MATIGQITNRDRLLPKKRLGVVVCMTLAAGAPALGSITTSVCEARPQVRSVGAMTDGVYSSKSSPITSSATDAGKRAFASGVALAAAELGITEQELMQRAIRNLPKKLGERRGGWAKEVTKVEKEL